LIMDSCAAKIKAHLKSLQPEMEKVLSELVHIESPSRDADAVLPVYDALGGYYAVLGYSTVSRRGKRTGGYMLARPVNRDKSKPLQLLVGHADTVWPKGTIDTMPVEEGDGKIKGPGVFDMKAGLTQMIFAIKTIQDLGLEMEVTPVILVNGDEEIGSRESTIMIKRLARIAERAYVLEPPLGLEGKLKTTRKGLGRFTATIKGVAAHAGLDPGKGASAILELSHVVQKFFALNDHERGITVNVGMIEGGVSANVVAPECSAVVDVRVPTNKDAEEVEAKIRSITSENPDVTVEIDGFFGRPPMEATKRNKLLYQQARAAAGALGMEIDETSAGGGSDANTTSQFTATLDGLGTTGDGAHARHEHIIRDAFIERTALLTLLLLLPSNKRY
jgi:glutamate carboxypeptidase